MLLPSLFLGCHITKTFNFTIRLNVPQVILRGEDLIDALNLNQRVDQIHNLVCSSVTTIEAIHCSTVYSLLLGADNSHHVLLIFFG